MVISWRLHACLLENVTLSPGDRHPVSWRTTSCLSDTFRFSPGDIWNITGRYFNTGSLGPVRSPAPASEALPLTSHISPNGDFGFLDYGESKRLIKLQGRLVRAPHFQLNPMDTNACKIDQCRMQQIFSQAASPPRALDKKILNKPNSFPYRASPVRLYSQGVIALRSRVPQGDAYPDRPKNRPHEQDG